MKRNRLTHTRSSPFAVNARTLQISKARLLGLSNKGGDATKLCVTAFTYQGSLSLRGGKFQNISRLMLQQAAHFYCSKLRH